MFHARGRAGGWTDGHTTIVASHNFANAPNKAFPTTRLRTPSHSPPTPSGLSTSHKRRPFAKHHHTVTTTNIHMKTKANRGGGGSGDSSRGWPLRGLRFADLYKLVGSSLTLRHVR